MSMDRLQKAIIAMKNPTVVGLDPTPAFIPEHILAESVLKHGESLEALADAFFVFNCGLIDAIHDIVPAVKPQAAYYEAIGPAGVVVLEKTCAYARKKGMYVILDGKRNDIGSTAEAYSRAYLGEVSFGKVKCSPFSADSLTVNAYLGEDGILPFIEDCKAHDKSIFALVKTSNPSSGQLQDLICGDRNLYTAVGDLLARISQDTVGEYGYSCVGAVVGATYPADAARLRKRLSETFFLVPGYGAQGGKASDVAASFDALGRGAIVNSSRQIIGAWQKSPKGDGSDYKEAAREKALEMKADLATAITIC